MAANPTMSENPAEMRSSVPENPRSALSKRSSNKLAPRVAGMLARKDSLNDSSEPRPLNPKSANVMPDLLIPGSTERLCANPPKMPSCKDGLRPRDPLPRNLSIEAVNNKVRPVNRVAVPMLQETRSTLNANSKGSPTMPVMAVIMAKILSSTPWSSSFEKTYGRALAKFATS